MHEGTEQFMSVDAIYWHQSYDYTTLDYDIMLMKLAHKVEVNDNVKPIALPKGCPKAGDMCTVSGWGNIYSDQGELPLNISTTATEACFFLHKTEVAVTHSVSLFSSGHFRRNRVCQDCLVYSLCMHCKLIELQMKNAKC